MGDQGMATVSGGRNTSAGRKVSWEGRVFSRLCSFSILFHMSSALLLQDQHTSHCRAPWVKRYNLLGKTKVTVLNKGAKDGFCVLALGFISSQQAEIYWLRSVPGPNSNFYTTSCFKHGPNWQIFSHVEPVCVAYSTELHLLTTDRISPGPVKTQNWSCRSPSEISDLETLCCCVTSPKHLNYLQDPPGAFPSSPSLLDATLVPRTLEGGLLWGTDCPILHANLSKHRPNKAYMCCCPLVVMSFSLMRPQPNSLDSIRMECHCFYVTS